MTSLTMRPTIGLSQFTGSRVIAQRAQRRPSQARSGPVNVKAFGFLKDLGLEKPAWLPNFNKGKRREEVDAALAAGEPVIVGPDYTVGAAFLATGAAMNAVHIAPLGIPLVLLGGLFGFQASQVRSCIRPGTALSLREYACRSS